MPITSLFFPISPFFSRKIEFFTRYLTYNRKKVIIEH